jgi:hypothetical protein
MKKAIMKETIRQLKYIYWGLLGGAIAYILFIEYFLMEAVGGMLADQQQVEFVVQMLMVLATLSAAYMVLRLFKTGPIVAKLKQSPSQYKYWSVARLLMIGLPLLLNFTGYLLFVNTSFFWLGAMLMLCFMFVTPSEGRYLAETERETWLRK